MINSRFCFHAICGSCSPFTAIHPETNNSERICLNCYSYYLKFSLEKESEEKKRLALQNQIKKIEEELSENHYKELEKIKEDKRSMEIQYKEQVNRLTREIEVRDSRITSMSFTESIKLSSSKSFEDENDDLKRKISDLLKKNQELDNKIKDLSSQASNLASLNSDLNKDNENLKKKLENSKNITAEPKSSCCSSCTIQ